MKTASQKPLPKPRPRFNIGEGKAFPALEIGAPQAPILFCGPCVIESREHAMRHAARIQEIAREHQFPLVYKSSFDKANRTAAGSFRGSGLAAGLEILAEVRATLGVPVITDVHEVAQVEAVARVADVIQIPAFLSRQTDLIIAAAETGKPLLIKKGQFLAPDDMQYALQKALQTGNDRVMLCERGSTFGYRELIVDFRALQIMRDMGCPVVFDATHSVQVIGGAGGSSSGNRQFVPLLARAAAAVGVDGFFVECHENPDSAPSDGPNMLQLESLGSLLSDLRQIVSLPLAARV